MKKVVCMIAVVGVVFAFQLGATANATSCLSKSLFFKITGKPVVFYNLSKKRDDDRWSWDYGDAD